MSTPRKKPAKRRCKGTNKAGERCGAAPLKGSDYCRAHDPKRPDGDRFGSPEQAAAAGASEKPRVPKLTEVLQRRVEEEAEQIIGVLFEGLEASRGITLRLGGGQDTLVETPDHTARIAAARELFDRAIGRPKQALEHSGPDGDAIRTEDTGAIDPSKLNRQQRAALREILDAQGG